MNRVALINGHYFVGFARGWTEDGWRLAAFLDSVMGRGRDGGDLR